ncbi:MAG TPA: YqzL family protein [Bacillota bacterium]|nr:YqzL family protein [Bacillota bacterium]
MIDLTWKLFSQTGNIETYLLLKELENEPNLNQTAQKKDIKTTSLHTNI